MGPCQTISPLQRQLQIAHSDFPLVAAAHWWLRVQRSDFHHSSHHSGGWVEVATIMAYSSMPYVGMAQEKMAATLNVHKWHTWNVCVRLVKGLYEPYQSLSSASMSNRAVNFFGKYRWKTRLASPKTGKSSIFWLRCSSTTIRSMTTTEAVTTIQTRKNSINHWLLHSPLIVVKKPEQVSGGSQVTPHLCLPLYAIFTPPEVNWSSMCSWHHRHAAAVIY